MEKDGESMKILVVFDDTGRKSDVIKDIIGDRGFSEVLVRKVRLEDRYRETLKSIFPDLSYVMHSIFS